MRSVRSDPAIGLIAELAVLAALARTTGLDRAGWAVGAACGVVGYAALSRAMAHAGAAALGPASRVTLTRATLAGGVAALVADSQQHPPALRVLVTLSVVALVLDAVDGWVARRTGTVSLFGARFDEEADAFLILVLSGYVARSLGGWVLAIGLAHYVVVVAAWSLPWLRRPLPPRYWNKVVAAVQGVTLTVAAAAVLQRTWTEVLLGASLVLLAESFGRELWLLWRQRHLGTGRVLVVAERGQHVH